ncbi:MAG: EAL domain-containing protein [Ilumatobacteraceae bacterium]
MPGLDNAASERPSGGSVADRALAAAIANLPSCFVMLVPVTALGVVLSRDQVDTARAIVWFLVSGLGSGLGYLAFKSFHRGARGGPADQHTMTLLLAAMVVAGLTLSLGTWANPNSTRTIVLMLTVIPASTTAVLAVVTAGRRDLFAAGLAPLTIVSVGTLLDRDDYVLRRMAALIGLGAAMMVILHHLISRTADDSIRGQIQTEQLAAQLERDHHAVADANTELAQSNDRLLHQALHDALTGLRNRRGTLDALDDMLTAATDAHPVGVLYIDLDRFKAVNDALGHRGGDRFLSVLADRLGRAVVRDSIVGRMGGDEFVVALPDMQPHDALTAATQIVSALAQPVHAEGREMPSSVSIGVASSPVHGDTASEVLRNANAALYRAKYSGRNRVEVFDEQMREELNARVEREQELRRALEDGEILPFFQPEIDASTGQIVGAELLARWLHRDGRLTSAHDFIELAAGAGLLERVTLAVIQGARAHISRLAALGLPEGFRFRANLGVEVTSHWRDHPIDEVFDGIDPRLLTVDAREAAVVGDLAAASANLAAFRARGGRVCLDDFARGVSSLSLLRRLPLDEVRIDRGSIDTITAHPHDRAIVRSIIALVRELGMAVTAEGVENGAQADTLIALGCVRQQGHLYSSALPAAAFENFLIDRLAENYRHPTPTTPTWETAELT